MRASLVMESDHGPSDERHEWSISPYNQRLALKKIELRDVTLREGEDCLGTKIPVSNKLKFSEALEAAGFVRIDVGFPGRDPKDFEFCSKLNDVSTLFKSGLVTSWQEKSEKSAVRSVAAGCNQVDVLLRCSDIQLRLHEETLSANLRRAQRIADLCHHRGVPYFAGLVDVTRMNVKSLTQLLRTEFLAECDGVILYDTVGIAAMSGAAKLVGMIAKHISKPICIHCHNDFGLAVANSLSSVIAGAEIIDVSTLGIGDRAGNTATEEIVAALNCLYSTQTTVRISGLTRLCRQFSEMTRFNRDTLKPIVGNSIGTSFAQLHRKDSSREWEAWLPFSPGTFAGGMGAKDR